MSAAEEEQRCPSCGLRGLEPIENEHMTGWECLVCSAVLDAELNTLPEPLEAPETPVEDDAEVEAPEDTFASFYGNLLGRDELAHLPQPEPLIDDTLDKRSQIMLGGQYGVGKSFIALDWGLCIATGKDWNGRQSHKGRVLYVIGEGATGVHQRVSAWEKHNNVTVGNDDFTVYREALQIAVTKDGKSPLALEAIKAIVKSGEYDLVILDTLARMTVGLNENASDDMGRYVEACEQIKRARDGVTVMTVHHAGKGDKADLRGSSALGGAMDIVYQAISEGDGKVKLTRTKRKDGPQFDEWHLNHTEVDGIDSIVLTPGDGPQRGHDSMTEDIIEFLAVHGASSTAAIEAAVEGKATRIRERLASLAGDSLMDPVLIVVPELTADGKPRRDGRFKYALSDEARRSYEVARESRHQAEAHFRDGLTPSDGSGDE